MNRYKKRLIVKTAIYLALIAAIIIYLMLCLNGMGARCFFERNFSISCPSCGATRTAFSLLSLDFVSAIKHNPIFGLIIYPSIIILAAQDYILAWINAVAKTNRRSMAEVLLRLNCSEEDI